MALDCAKRRGGVVKMDFEHAVSTANSHLLKAKIAYLECDCEKSIAHALIATNIATFTIFNKVGGAEKIIAATERKIAELESLMDAAKRKAV
ncbi:MAG: hypothetical protein HYT72_05280 [Candidatus Aenigmarchaeota archaeon]|nr:hypothetical protein [Candidatus Aenigmarchaeota archaeon]